MNGRVYSVQHELFRQLTILSAWFLGEQRTEAGAAATGGPLAHMFIKSDSC